MEEGRKVEEGRKHVSDGRWRKDINDGSNVTEGRTSMKEGRTSMKEGR